MALSIEKIDGNLDDELFASRGLGADAFTHVLRNGGGREVGVVAIVGGTPYLDTLGYLMNAEQAREVADLLDTIAPKARP